MLHLVLGKEKAYPLRSRVQAIKRVYTSWGQGDLYSRDFLGRVKSSKTHPRDYLDIDQGCKDESLVQSTSKGSQIVKDERKKGH